MRRDTTSKREWSADVCSSDLLPATTPTSSVTAPVMTPPSTGVSLVPWMVTVTSWLAVPSEDTAVKLSVMLWPAPSCWIAELGRAAGRVGVQAAWGVGLWERVRRAVPGGGGGRAWRGS